MTHPRVGYDSGWGRKRCIAYDRLYRTPRWYLERPPDYSMIVPQELLNSVVFLGEKRVSGDRFGGTAYFTSVPSAADPNGRHVYLVTARHCVEGRTNLIARVNVSTDPASGTRTIDLPPGDSEEWLFLDEHGPGEDFVDLAALCWPEQADLQAAGYRWVPRSMYFDEALFGDLPMQGRLPGSS